MSETATDAERQSILDAARRQFDEQGWFVSIHDIAKSAGVSAGTVSRHFAGKRDLILATYDSLLRPLVTEIGSDDPGESLAKFTHDLAAIATAHPAVAVALLPGTLGPVSSGIEHIAVDAGQLADCLGGLIAANWRNRTVVGSMTENAEVYLFGLLGYILAHPDDHSARAATILLNQI